MDDGWRVESYVWANEKINYLQNIFSACFLNPIWNTLRASCAQWTTYFACMRLGDGVLLLPVVAAEDLPDHCEPHRFRNHHHEPNRFLLPLVNPRTWSSSSVTFSAGEMYSGPSGLHFGDCCRGDAAAATSPASAWPANWSCQDYINLQQSKHPRPQRRNQRSRGS